MFEDQIFNLSSVPWCAMVPLRHADGPTSSTANASMPRDVSSNPTVSVMVLRRPVWLGHGRLSLAALGSVRCASFTTPKPRSPLMDMPRSPALRHLLEIQLKRKLSPNRRVRMSTRCRVCSSFDPSASGGSISGQYSDSHRRTLPSRGSQRSRSVSGYAKDERERP